MFRGLKSSYVRTSGEGPVCNYLLLTNGFHVRGVDPSDLPHEHEKLTSCHSKDWGGFSLSDCGGPVDNDSASGFV